jgi:hypothetical protein
VKKARFFIATLSLFIFGAIGHLVGGGSIANFKQHSFYLILIFTLVSFLAKRELSGPNLAAAIVIAQFSTHLFFGSSHSSDNLMFFSHLSLSLLNYFTARQSEKILEDLILTVFTFLQRFIKLVESFVVNPGSRARKLFSNSFSFRSVFLKGAISLRAPPAF